VALLASALKFFLHPVRAAGERFVIRQLDTDSIVWNAAQVLQHAFIEWRRNKPDWQFTEYQKEGPWRLSFIATRPVFEGIQRANAGVAS
jgi:hypothetical protein